MRNFFYKYWVLYYILFFLLIGLLIYALLWTPDLSRYTKTINDLNNRLEDCSNKQRNDSVTMVVDTLTSKIDNTINCDASIQSGGKGVTTTRHELGRNSGSVIIEYDMKSLPDEINVFYDNIIVASSKGLVSNRNMLKFKYTAVAGKPTYCVVRISAPYDNTEWNYLLNCPQ